jgi:hypothetical protein
MDTNQYSAELDRLQEPTAANMQSLAGWTLATALPWLWEELSGAVLAPRQKHPQARSTPTKQILKPMNESNAVRHGLMLTLADRATKVTDPDYYQAQLTMLDAQARLLCTAIQDWGKQQNPPPDVTIHTLHRALHEMLRYARILLEQAGTGVAGVPGYYGAWRRTFDTSFEVIQASRQAIYGAYSGLAFADRAPWVSIAVLRTAIELRLREAFMIWGFVSESKPENAVPIDMSTIFEAISPSEKDISFAVDIHDVWKIYRWSNHYLHAGSRDYPWVPGFLLHYMWPLFVGKQGQGSFNAGIQMSEATWKTVRSRVTPKSRSTTIKELLKDAWRAIFSKPVSNDLALPDCSPSNAGFVLKP